MRPINVSLDATTWELAKKKPNFSAWVRSQLRAERMKKETKDTKFCFSCWKQRRIGPYNECVVCLIPFGGEEE